MTMGKTLDGKNHLRVHPMFLHSNATSHKWAFGAIAELLDNAVDEANSYLFLLELLCYIQNGAPFVVIDKTTNPRDGNPALLIQDDGGGIDPETIRRCMSFGFSDKKMKFAIGQYGNGFKTSSMRLGADVIVFTCHLRERTLTQSVGLLSYTFLRQTGHDRIVVPLVDYGFNESTTKLEPILSYGQEHFSSNLSVLLQWSPYLTEEIMLKQLQSVQFDILINPGGQFDDIGNHGTKIVIYNLWLNDNGDMELDFDLDAEDIRVIADPKLLQTGCRPNQVSDQHIANLYHYSLRVYSSILYLRAPQSFKIVLRGRVVEHHNIANDLKFPEFILYKSHGGNMERVRQKVVEYVCLSRVRHGYGSGTAWVRLWYVLGTAGAEIKFSEKLRAKRRLRPSLSSSTSTQRSTSTLVFDFDFDPEITLVFDFDPRHRPTPEYENQLQDDEFTSLMQENEKLQTQLLELERSEECLTLKVRQLRKELGDIQSEYARLVAESESMNIVKDEKTING
ncbi:hypothetical protein TEA_020479 [Camellia sinensis var. sinensis]|uniref:Morc S5 domain-containing protein n=1 Tax=Camellia sinensis var. sinensis TaxID=542762 RepID=A0A4S4D6U3_CAMSN|nr:hypothetical protein TEA_020479 [Camellia sinensis var. sinensis]